MGFKIKRMFLVGMMFFGLILSGCASYTPIEQGVIGTEGVTIMADDESFFLKSGERFTTPFVYKKSIAEILKPNTPKVDLWKDALKKKAGKKVSIKIDSEDRELFGVLAFGSVKKIKQCTGPAIRSHMIKIDDQYIAAAEGGKIAVMYETYKCRGRRTDISWMLWMSDIPF